MTSGLVCDRASEVDAVITLARKGEKLDAALKQVNAGAKMPRRSHHWSWRAERPVWAATSRELYSFFSLTGSWGLGVWKRSLHHQIEDHRVTR